MSNTLWSISEDQCGEKGDRGLMWSVSEFEIQVDIMDWWDI